MIYMQLKGKRTLWEEYPKQMHRLSWVKLYKEIHMLQYELLAWGKQKSERSFISGNDRLIEKG